MRHHRIPHFWLFLAFAWSILVGLTSAAPAPATLLNSSTETLFRRQEDGNPLTQPVVTHTVQTINTYVFFQGFLCVCWLIHCPVLLVVVVVIALQGLLQKHALSR
jgi:ABC-type bacteriocin/lantibiotic exporter with double-glycine peptidase domain